MRSAIATNSADTVIIVINTIAATANITKPRLPKKVITKTRRKCALSTAIKLRIATLSGTHISLSCSSTLLTNLQMFTFFRYRRNSLLFDCYYYRNACVEYNVSGVSMQQFSLRNAASKSF